jgi:hypothetical protein
MRGKLNNLSILLCGAILATTGCGTGRPQPADRNVARETLQRSLQAWKNGEPAVALQNAEPSITVADREWAVGTKLLDYRIDGKDQLFGADLRCTVYLTLDGGARSQPRKKKATYSVGTGETLTVVRTDDD